MVSYKDLNTKVSSTPYGENDYIRDYETFKNTAL